MVEPQSARSAGASLGIVLRLSRSDLANEWILTLCLVMAIAAVLSPLMILFGLKYGTIQTLRHRLVQDPRNREIRPMVSKSFNREWFEQMRGRTDVAFIVPTTRQISATMDVALRSDSSSGGNEKIQLDIVPTDEGDPLLLENGAGIPGRGECVLTQAAAEALGAKLGSHITGSARRYRDGRFEASELPLVVSGILDPRAGSLKILFLRLEVLDAVEHYKDGQAVPEYGWAGSTPAADPLYDGLIAIPSRELTAVGEYQLASGTGFTRVRRLQADEIPANLGFKMAGDRIIYLLNTVKERVGQESVDSVRNRLRGMDPVLIPIVKDLEGELLETSGRKVATLRLRGLTVNPETARAIGIDPIPDWGGSGAAALDFRQIMLPAGKEWPAGGASLRVSRGEESLTFPVQITPQTAPGPDAFIPIQLAGILNLFKERNLSFDPDLSQFVLARRGFAGFRLYAASIDDVDRLRRDFDTMGIPIHTEADRIRDVTQLDGYITLIFWLIAAVGVTGGIAVLTASLYASVQRKQKEISVLRLLGFSRGMLFRFPIYQGVFISTGGFLVAAGFFQALALLINTLFRGHLHAGESFCRLSAWHMAATLGGTIAVAILASSAAAWQTTRIDPAEALRDE